MSQNSVVMPTSGVVSGLTFANDVNAAFDAVRTLWSGASAPTADAAEEGQRWLDTSVANYATYKIYDGASWVAVFTIDLINHLIIANVVSIRKAVADAGYVATIYDRLIAYTSITVTRAVTLPAASTYPAGVQLTIVDESGSASNLLAITLTPNGGDTIKGPPGVALAITGPYGFLKIASNGTSQWTLVGSTPIPIIPGGGF